MLKETLLDATRAAAMVMKDRFGSAYRISSKSGINDLVTEIDKLCEEVIIGRIGEHYPDHDILSEEAGELKQDSAYRWIIDPIDGTVNFAHGVPICCVSVALEKDGRMLMGAVYNPFLEEFFFAEKGAGATLNGQPIAVSAKDRLESAFLVTGFPYQWEDMPHDPMEVFGRFVRAGLPLRRMGSAAIDLCWVAAGRFDGFWEHNLNAWDAAAGYLIVEEAGGRVTDYGGHAYSPYQRRILATNGLIHEALLGAIHDPSAPL